MSGQRLCNLLNDILDAASLNNRSLRLVDEDVPLAAVCEHVMHLTKAVLKKVRGPSLAPPPPPLAPSTSHASPPPPLAPSALREASCLPAGSTGQLSECCIQGV